MTAWSTTEALIAKANKGAQTKNEEATKAKENTKKTQKLNKTNQVMRNGHRIREVQQDYGGKTTELAKTEGKNRVAFQNPILY